MIRALRKRHRLTFMILAVVLTLIILLAVSSRPEWPQQAAAPTQAEVRS